MSERKRRTKSNLKEENKQLKEILISFKQRRTEDLNDFIAIEMNATRLQEENALLKEQLRRQKKSKGWCGRCKST